MENVTLRQLRVFASFARHLSFTRAAEELSLTAPAVSMQINEFEAEVRYRRVFPAAPARAVSSEAD
jgi:DNA-binding transcriptional LysR family regulator